MSSQGAGPHLSLHGQGKHHTGSGMRCSASSLSTGRAASCVAPPELCAGRVSALPHQAGLDEVCTPEAPPTRVAPARRSHGAQQGCYLRKEQPSPPPLVPAQKPELSLLTVEAEGGFAALFPEKRDPLPARKTALLPESRTRCRCKAAASEENPQPRAEKTVYCERAAGVERRSL